MINLLKVICYKFRAISKCPISKCEISKRLISKRLISKCLISKREISKRGISKRDFGFQVSFFQVGLRSGITPVYRHFDSWDKIGNGKVPRKEIQKLFGENNAWNYNATCDLPMCGMWDVLKDEFPDAKGDKRFVLCNLHSLEKINKI